MSPPDTASLVPDVVLAPPRSERTTPEVGSSPPLLTPSRRTRVRQRGGRLVWAVLGLAAVGGVWAVLAASNPDLPSPSEAWRTWWTLLRAPFSRTAESNLGIGWQLAGSLRRVGTGFLLAAAVGIPLGLLLGGSRRAWAAMNPVVQLLRPVSPLAWFPICLVVLRDAPRAAIWVIFITALWPIVLNTAAGARSVPADQLHVARVFRFGRVSFVRHILLPNTIPSLITGLRLAMGTAWMVIVAVEMLAGGTGIGFFVWDSYNALDLSRVVCAIVLIGLVGLCIDALFLRLARRFEPGEAHR